MSPPRRWLELRVRGLSAEGPGGLLAEGLLALGGRAVEERDGWYLTHLAEPDDLAAFLTEARVRLARLSGDPELVLEHRWQDHEDWAESWKRGLATRHLTRRLVVTPSWIPYQAVDGQCVLVLDPGMAFGTAEHGTTRGCLRFLDGVVEEGERLLDVGAGSGILSVAGALLGAAEVVAVEGDELACEAMEENLARNGVRDRVGVVPRWVRPAELQEWAPRDGVMANIEWSRLRPLVPGLSSTLAPGGWLILSGILRTEMEEARATAAEVGLDLLDTDADGSWRTLLLERPAG